MARGRFAGAGSDDAVDIGGGQDYEYTDYNYTYYNTYYGSAWACASYDQTSDPRWLASHWIKMVVFPILLIQGIVGNAIAVPVLFSLGRSAWSTLIYLALLCLSDVIVLLVRCGNSWYYEITGTDPSQDLMNTSDAVCRTYMFAFTFVLHIDPWLMVAAAIEMTITTRWPKRTHEACTTERARNVVMLLTLILVCLDINHFWTWGVPAPRPQVGCRYTEEFSEQFRDWIWPALENSVRLILPLIIVFLCVVITVLTVAIRPASREKELHAHMRKYILELPTLSHFRSAVFVLSLLFLLVVIFSASVELVTFLFNRQIVSLPDDCMAIVDFGATMEIVKTVELTISFIFYSTKIYVFATLSPAFRASVARGFWRIVHFIARLFQRCVLSMLSRFSSCRPVWTPVARDNSGDDDNGDLDQIGQFKQTYVPAAGRLDAGESYIGPRAESQTETVSTTTLTALNGNDVSPVKIGDGRGLNDFLENVGNEAPQLRETWADVHNGYAWAMKNAYDCLNSDHPHYCNEHAADDGSLQQSFSSPRIPLADGCQMSARGLNLRNGNIPCTNRTEPSTAKPASPPDPSLGTSHQRLYTNKNYKNRVGEANNIKDGVKHTPKLKTDYTGPRSTSPVGEELSLLQNGSPGKIMTLRLDDLGHNAGSMYGNGTKHNAYGDHLV